MTKKLFFSALLLLFSALSAQIMPPYTSTDNFLDANDMQVFFNSAGDMSWDLLGEPRFEVPKGSGHNCIFAGSPWIGGIDHTGQLRTAGQTYRQTGHDYWPGPVANTYDSAYFSRYTRVWKVNKTTIDVHKARYNQAGYTPPASIRNWPGNGDPANGEPAQMAPFVDMNLNGQYEPAMGDYPDIPGDQALYMVYTDAHFPNTETGGERTGIEIHSLSYVFDADSGEAIDQTLFMHHRLINKSGINYSEFRYGHWLDFDLGLFRDDRVGCDTNLNAFFVYNGDNDDEGTFNYGTPPPAVGLVFLNQKMNYFRTYFNDFSASGNPTTANDYYQYLQDSWKDGSKLTYGGDGTGGTTPTRYMFPGDPLDSTGWSEISAGIGFGERKAVGSIGPYRLNAGESICVDMAIVFARTDTGNHLTSVVELKERIREVQAYYDTTISICPKSPGTAIDPGEVKPVPFTLYPNPAQHQLFIQMENKIEKLSIFDIQGRLILSEEVQGVSQKSWDISAWPAGMYLCTVEGKHGHWTRKWVKK